MVLLEIREASFFGTLHTNEKRGRINILLSRTNKKVFLKKMTKQKNLKGLSLVEMIVAIAVMSLIMAGVTLYFARIWPLQRFAIDSSQAQRNASQSVTGLVTLLRNMRQADSGEYAFSSAGSTEIIFFSDQDGDGAVERVRIFRDGTDLKLGSINPSGSPVSYPVNTEEVRTLVTDVRNGSGSYASAIFHYYDEGNEELSGAFSVGDVRMVSVDMYIDINPSASPVAAHFESFASIRNLSEYDRLQ